MIKKINPYQLNSFFDENELDQNYRTLIVKILNVRKNDLIEYLKQKIASMDNMQLKDFDWSVKVRNFKNYWKS